MIRLTLLTIMAGLIAIVAACDNYSHNSIVNTPPTNYVDVTMMTTYGGDGYDWGTSVAVNDEDEYVITGSTTSNGYGPNTVYLSKSDPDGNRLWYHFFGGWGDDNGEAVLVTSDSNIIVAGVTSSFDLETGHKIDPNSGKPLTDSNFYLIRTNPSGLVLWEKAFGDSLYDEWATSLALGSDYYIVAGFQYRSESEQDLYFMRVDFAGNLEWQKPLGTAGLDRAADITRTRDGAFVAGGYTRDPVTSRTDPYLIKINSAGTSLWERIDVDASSSRQINSLVGTSDGGVAAVGTYLLPATPPVKLLYVLKTDANGEILWQNTYLESRINEGRAIRENPDGTLTVCGQNSSLNAIHIAKLKATGELVWSDSTVADGYGMSMSACETGYAITGSTGYPNQQVLNDVLLLKIEEDLTNVD